MSRRVLALSGACVGAALYGAIAFAQEPATTFGTVELAEGAVTVQAPDGTTTTPQAGDTIASGSTILTGEDGEVHIATEDSGYVALRPNTQLRIDNYRAEGGDDDSMALSLLKGTFRAITGWIGSYNRDNYRISTPTATIGIRGTDHEPGFVTEEDAARLGEEAGTYDKVNDGGSYIQNAQGRAEIAPNQSGFVPHRGGFKPRLLDHAPRFYRATRHENRILQRRAAVRSVMHQRRGERHAAWLKHRSEGVEHPAKNAERKEAERKEELKEERKEEKKQHKRKHR